MYYYNQIDIDIYFKTGSGNKRRILRICDLLNNLEMRKSASNDHSASNIATSIVGFHAITGCDSVSSFAGKGKIKGLKLLLKSSEYVDLFSEFGTDWSFTDELFTVVEKFVGGLYWYPNETVNSLRYMVKLVQNNFLHVKMC